MFYGKLFWLLDTLNSRTFIESIKKQEFETGIHNWACHLKKKILYPIHYFLQEINETFH